MEISGMEKRVLSDEKQKIEIASLRRLLMNHDEFFNFVNLHDGWYRWVTGKYSVTSIDSMGETLIKYLCQFCNEYNLLSFGYMSADRVLALNYKGVHILFRKLDGKDDFSAVSLIDEQHNFKVISWDKLYSYMEKELEILLAEEINLPVNEPIESKSYISE
jgi:hypothetical protein